MVEALSAPCDGDSRGLESPENDGGSGGEDAGGLFTGDPESTRDLPGDLVTVVLDELLEESGHVANLRTTPAPGKWRMRGLQARMLSSAAP